MTDKTIEEVEFIVPKIRFLSAEDLVSKDLEIGINYSVDNHEGSKECLPEEFETLLNENEIGTDFCYFSFTDIKAMQKDFLDLLEYIHADLEGNFENIEPKVYKRILERWKKEKN